MKIMDIAVNSGAVLDENEYSLKSDKFSQFGRNLVKHFIDTLSEQTKYHDAKIEPAFKNAQIILEKHFSLSKQEHPKWTVMAIQNVGVKEKDNMYTLKGSDIIDYGNSVLEEASALLREHGKVAQLTTSMNSFDMYVGFNAAANILNKQFKDDPLKMKL